MLSRRCRPQAWEAPRWRAPWHQASPPAPGGFQIRDVVPSSLQTVDPRHCWQDTVDFISAFLELEHGVRLRTSLCVLRVMCYSFWEHFVSTTVLLCGSWLFCMRPGTAMAVLHEGSHRHVETGRGTSRVPPRPYGTMDFHLELDLHCPWCSSRLFSVVSGRGGWVTKSCLCLETPWTARLLSPL